MNRGTCASHAKDGRTGGSHAEKSVAGASATESQGLALAEAWSMDVPTLVWSPNQEHSEVPGLFPTGAPYLTGATGKYWKDLSDLREILSVGFAGQFSPREWILNNMTNKLAAKNYLAIAQQGN